MDQLSSASQKSQTMLWSSLQNQVLETSFKVEKHVTFKLRSGNAIEGSKFIHQGWIECCAFSSALANLHLANLHGGLRDEYASNVSGILAKILASYAKWLAADNAVSIQPVCLVHCNIGEYLSDYLSCVT